jgi:hypothetical protein
MLELYPIGYKSQAVDPIRRPAELGPEPALLPDVNEGTSKERPRANTPNEDGFTFVF